VLEKQDCQLVHRIGVDVGSSLIKIAFYTSSLDLRPSSRCSALVHGVNRTIDAPLGPVNTASDGGVTPGAPTTLVRTSLATESRIHTVSSSAQCEVLGLEDAEVSQSGGKLRFACFETVRIHDAIRFLQEHVLPKQQNEASGSGPGSSGVNTQVRFVFFH
jgi:hypothetical protein